ncbi:uncharacterized protein TNCT_92051 [Trichonephila clavata]|uniref:HAUS augmin-like complex subunit 5 n=1 Tax=Trichonephila clavata TaxID=2740835 RepID=A0A8X6K8S7_TRICU|nr:uncharacterized protein TNCT_92051 [Trichonephila clavata]
MTTLEEKLQDWIVNETSFLTEGRLAGIPDINTLRRLTEGKNKEIWMYIITHVRSQYSVQRIRRILKLKRDQKNPEKHLNLAPSFSIPDIHSEITRATGKRKFLGDSICTIKKEIVSTEKTVQDIRQEIDKVHQKTAILQLTSLHYQEKTAVLNSLHRELFSHLSEGLHGKNCKFSFEAPVEKIQSNLLEDIPLKMKYILPHIASLIIKIFKNSSDSKSLTLNLQKRVEQVFKNILIHDILFVLKELSKVSYVNIIETGMCNQKRTEMDKLPDCKQKRLSEKLLEELRLDHINCVFDTKKAKNDFFKLISEKELLLTSKFNLKSVDSEYQNKCLLLSKIVENESLRTSIQCLEKILSEKQTEIKLIKQINTEEAIPDQAVTNAQVKFYENFDIMILLQESAPEVLNYILKCFIDIRRFVNEQLFVNMSMNLRDYPHEMKNNLKYEIEALLHVLKKNEVIKPLLQEPLPLKQQIPDILWDKMEVLPFQNLREVCHNVKSLKTYISKNQKCEFKYDEKQLPKMQQLYDSLIDKLIKMQNELYACESELDTGLESIDKVQLALQEWWEQSAQFIPDIEYDGKTLKMWLDILSAVDDIDILEVTS